MSLVLTPLYFALMVFLWPKRANVVALLGLGVQFGLTLYTAFWTPLPRRITLGDWGAPLGIELWLSPLSLLFCLLSSAVFLGVGLYANTAYKNNHKERSRFFVLAFFLSLGLTLLFVSDDVFNLYVALEIVGLSAIGLSALRPTKEALRASLTYLFTTLVGSGAYLLGVALLYGEYGVLSLDLLSKALISSPTSNIAFGLMAAGLILKTALFPLHFWLPKAHANATSPVSALLSGLVIKGSFFLLYRLWFDGGLGNETLGHGLGILGGVGVLYASVLALLQTKLKRIIAYSTVAQIGYLFLVFGLVKFDDSLVPREGILLLALAHGLAKAGMFLAAGALVYVHKKDDLVTLQGVGSYAPLSVFSFGIAAVSIMGLPPSLGFFGKWLLLLSAFEHREMIVAGVFIAGGVLSAGYMFRPLSVFFAKPTHTLSLQRPPLWLELPALGLSLGALALGFFTSHILDYAHG
ncbi:hypothetical protein JWV37_05720 [Sulfurospirillum sp. T05]|uniref:NADH:quinone oxidoreductase/Mrp antiporter transmembrane domain-containing protein n=1 Tax=Sulfurospirillum tamanense TaxID=2813362 RepID=A0ABS2WSC1_9BACT|nr:proton-conducting transporter membrane subunit [Sulfurospirillum tamanensis]MBN2964268.1 hypothetical protein [Sulfurospirillum tamanensis]